MLMFYRCAVVAPSLYEMTRLLFARHSFEDVGAAGIRHRVFQARVLISKALRRLMRFASMPAYLLRHL